MDIKYGSIEFFELENLGEILKGWRYDKLDLLNLDKLRMEINLKLKAIYDEHTTRISRLSEASGGNKVM